jgi:hypothetical protein
MDKKQTLEEAELSDAVIGNTCRLKSFFTRDTDADMLVPIELVIDFIWS